MRDKNKFEQTKSFYNVWQRPTIFMANCRFKSITSESLQSIKTAQLDQMIIEWGREGVKGGSQWFENHQIDTKEKH